MLHFGHVLVLPVLRVFFDDTEVSSGFGLKGKFVQHFSSLRSPLLILDGFNQLLLKRVKIWHVHGLLLLRSSEDTHRLHLAGLLSHLPVVVRNSLFDILPQFGCHSLGGVLYPSQPEFVVRNLLLQLFLVVIPFLR